ncbi:kelch-like protein 9 [Lytechinus variegatus]|uniref:kelch-like protein 9 n=1 Tax=Lytechinus variegatus TaxID=7654 RepID=UPI001BB1D10E|nr:kelch-like protein 9 [Lytechinus variegatus]
MQKHKLAKAIMNTTKDKRKPKAQNSKQKLKHVGKKPESAQYTNRMPPRVSRRTPISQDNYRRPATTGILPSKLSRLSTVVETSNVNVQGADHATKILGSVTTLWRKKQLQDVVLAVGHHRVGAHRLILAACSGYFCELFTSEEDDPSSDGEQFVYTLHGVGHEIVKMLLESMYTSSLAVTYENIDELLNAALYLRIQTALDSCTNFLLENLTSETCLRTLSVAISFDMEDIFERACQQVASHFVELSITDEFLDLSEETLLCLVSRDDLHVDDELEVFHACTRWLEHDLDSRLPYLVQLLRRVRLPMITPSEIVDFVESVPYIMRNPQCESLVKDALHYHCLPYRQSVLQSSRTVPRSSLHITTPIALGGQPRRTKEPVGCDVMFYKQASKEWVTLTEMEHPRHHHAAATLGGFLYIAGGRETTSAGSPLRSTHRYDPRINAWLHVADMIDGRESFQLGVLNGKIYAVGGRVDDKTSLSAVERYDPCRDVWEAVESLGDPRRCVAVAAHSNRLYAMGGSGNQKISSKVEYFDDDKDEWQACKCLRIPRFFSILLPHGDYLYLAGGATADSTGTVRCIPHIEQYNPRKDTWIQLSPMATPRAEMAGSVVNGMIYLIGGYNWESKSWLHSVEKYNIEEDDWESFKDYPKAFTGIAGCALTLYSMPP